MTAPLLYHRRFKEAAEALLIACRMATPGQIIFVVGPSGIGKKELRQYAMRHLTGPASSWGAGELAALWTIATLRDGNHFSPKAFMRDLVDQALYPKLGWLTPRGKEPDAATLELLEAVQRSKAETSSLRMRGTELEMARSFELLCATRKIKYVFIDEAASMCKTTQRGHIHNHILSYMQLAERTETVWIMLGGHRMAPLWKQYSDTRRRALMIWARRYNESVLEDKEAFAQMVKAIGKTVPLSKRTLLFESLDLCLANSAGIYGELERFLEKALFHARCQGRESITRDDLVAGAYAEDEQATLWTDARACDLLATPHPDPTSLKHLAVKWTEQDQKSEVPA